MLSRLIDPQSFPVLTAIIATGAFDDVDRDFDDEFTFGLDCVLDAVEALVGARREGN